MNFKFANPDLEKKIAVFMPQDCRSTRMQSELSAWSYPARYVEVPVGDWIDVKISMPHLNKLITIFSRPMPHSTAIETC